MTTAKKAPTFGGRGILLADGLEAGTIGNKTDVEIGRYSEAGNPLDGVRRRRRFRGDPAAGEVT